MRSSSPWLAIAASISLFACYAELPGSAPDILFAGVDAGPVGGGTGGGTAGGTTLGGDTGG